MSLSRVALDGAQLDQLFETDLAPFNELVRCRSVPPVVVKEVRQHEGRVSPKWPK